MVIDDLRELGSDQARRQLEMLVMRALAELRFVLAWACGGQFRGRDLLVPRWDVSDDGRMPPCGLGRPGWLARRGPAGGLSD